MNRRTMPFMLMLLAGMFACIMTFVNEYSVIDKLLVLSVVMFMFYILGRVMQKALDYFDKQNEEKRKVEEAREKEQLEQEEMQKQQESDEGEKE